MKSFTRALAKTWTRRTWLVGTATTTTRAAALAAVANAVGHWDGRSRTVLSRALSNEQRACLDPTPLEALTTRAVEAAQRVGASYADARFTRHVQESFDMTGKPMSLHVSEEVGLGVRVLVDGYWGFAASYRWTDDEAVRLATAAVAQARQNASGPHRAVTLTPQPAVTGQWHTPIRLDPFTQVPLEEKMDWINYWRSLAGQAGIVFDLQGLSSLMCCVRQECVLATSEGSLVNQTVYETGGRWACSIADPRVPGSAFGLGGGGPVYINDIDFVGKGWEVFLDAKLPDQFPQRRDEAIARGRIRVIPIQLGRYTIVCDGATMASVLDHTIGVATQLDRALGYEANAGGTSYLTDPLTMLGTFRTGSPAVTVTANRSAPTQLATVKWDAEGVAPADITLIRKGIVVDFQTTREQASWLTSYYQRAGRPVQSNGYAAAESAHFLQIQHAPNLALSPNATNVRLDDLIQSVADGIFVERGGAAQMDFQARTGVLWGNFREIKNGRLGKWVQGGAFLLNTTDFWNHVTAIGGPTTQGAYVATQFAPLSEVTHKGEPRQNVLDHTVVAPAATITGQPLINLSKKA